MKRQPAKKSFLWVRHVFLAVVIMIIAGIVIFMQQKSSTTIKPEGQEGSKSIAQNMSDFYSGYRNSSRHPREEDLGDFVMKVNLGEEPLDNRLKKMESLQKPVSGRWVGEHKHRTFKAGSTLRSAITDYAQSEGMQVIWELNRDFIVKHPFQLDDSILGSLKVIATAIDASFDGEVKAYMCPRQRSLVITSKSSEYLQKNCALAR